MSIRTRRIWGRIFASASLVATLLGVGMLGLLMWDVISNGAAWLSWEFLNHFPSRFPEQAGIKSALWGSIWLIVLTALFAIPIGVGASIYLEEYARDSKLKRLLEMNISNLAGVPSIVYGILGLALFVRALGLGRSLLAGALTMALLILPIIIVSSQEAIRAIPRSIRDASYALGATKWETIRHQVLPASLPSILTGVILALSRALGEAAPLIMIGALTFVAFTPSGPTDQFTALPIQIFNWASRPQAGFHGLAAAGIIVLLVLLILMNATAIIIRNRYQRRFQW